MTTAISIAEVDFHPTSFCDEDGRVFWWQGELYRGISDRYAPFCQKLFDTGVVNSLVDAGFLIETELTDLSLPSYPLVLKHRQLSFVSYASEWCPEMLKDAAQFTLDMMRQLAPYGLTVDVGTWDILYDGSQPRYVDFCSIVAANTYDRHSWNGALDDFSSYFINPLKLASQGKGHLARWLLADYEHRTIHAELAALMGHQRIYGQRQSDNRLVSKVRDKLAIRRDPCRPDLIKKMQRSLNQIHLPALCAEPTAPRDRPHTSPKKESQKKETLRQLMSTLRPATILDVGCGSGDYARLAAAAGAQVVAIDRDDRQIARCYQAAKAQQLPILPLAMDICYPSAAQGAGNPVLAAATDRLACELVIALDLLPLLVFEQHLTLEKAVEAIAPFSTQWLLLEFSDPAAIIDSADLKRTDSYQLQHLLDLLRRQFQQVDILPSKKADCPLILCRRSA